MPEGPSPRLMGSPSPSFLPLGLAMALPWAQPLGPGAFGLFPLFVTISFYSPLFVAIRCYASLIVAIWRYLIAKSLHVA